MTHSPTTPGDPDGDERMEDRSDLEDDTHLDDTTELRAGDSRSETLQNGRSYVEADEPTHYSLFSNPPNLGMIRQRLFEIDDSIEMSQGDFDAYFPFVDNVWRKSKAGEVVRDRDLVTDVYWCRLRKSNNAKPYVPKPTPEGKTSRKKRVRDDKTCPMAIRVVRNDGGVSSVSIQRAVGPEVRHSHDLEYMDALKRNTGIMDVARREAVRAFLPGSVFWKMQEEPDKMDAAGGKHMKISDVRNVQYAWRQENQNALLKAHTGYSQQSKGPRPKDPTQTGLPPPPPPPPAPAPLPPHSTQHHTTEVRPPPPPPDYGPTHARVSTTSSAPAATPVQVHIDDPLQGALQYPERAREFLEPYLVHPVPEQARPHVTLTWATSLDSRIALMPQVQTAISGPETKAMTHFLRSRHDAIIVGVNTAVADDPSLNCRLVGAGGYGGPHTYQQPRPIIIDPHARLHIRPDMKVLKVVSEGRAKGPWVIVAPSAQLHPVAIQTLRNFGGEYLMINDVNPQTGRLNWEAIFNVLFKEGIRSIMVEGGGQVLSELLKTRYNGWIDSVILTIAPTFFGRAGVEVSPEPTFDQQTRQPLPTRLKDIRWQPMGDADVVMCGHVRYDQPHANGILPGIQEFSQQPPPPPSKSERAASPHPQRHSHHQQQQQQPSRQQQQQPPPPSALPPK